MDWPGVIRRCFDEDRVLYTAHARREMRQEEFGPISDAEVYDAVCNADVIETYPDDKPYPSVLLFGQTNRSRPLHVVCAFDAESEQAIIVTTYEPDPDLWYDYRRRKR
jgi:hypothetical protein